MITCHSGDHQWKSTVKSGDHSLGESVPEIGSIGGKRPLHVCVVFLKLLIRTVSMDRERRFQYRRGQALTIGLVTNYLLKIHMDRRIYKLQSIGRRQESSVLLWSGLRMTVKSQLYIFLQAQTFLSLESSDCAFLL